MGSTLDQISVIVVGYAALVTVIALVLALRRAGRPPWLDQLVWMLEFLLVLRALAGAGAMLGGQEAEEPATHIGYLVASVCVLPILMQSLGQDRGNWSVAVVAVGALAVVVVAARTWATW